MKTYRVYGYCLVPCFAEVQVESESMEAAKREALDIFKKHKNIVDESSADRHAAYDWRPEVEEQS